MSSPADDPAERRRAAALSGHAGDVETARVLAEDPDEAVRSTALGALARAGSLDGSVLARALCDPSPIVRRRAVELAATWVEGDTGQADADVSLLPLLDDEDASVIEAAAWASGERGAEPGTVTRLAELTTSHPDTLVREAAVAALGAIGDRAGLPAILGATHDRATVRRRAVIALAPFEGPDVEDALERARTDRDWQVRQAAEDLLDPG